MLVGSHTVLCSGAFALLTLFGCTWNNCNGKNSKHNEHAEKMNESDVT